MLDYWIQEIPYQQTWAIRHQVMWPDKDLNYVKLPEDHEGTLYGLFVQEELTTILSVFIDKNQAQFRKFATLVKAQGKGYGSALLDSVFENLKARSIEKVWCNARADKVFFYERFGMVKTDREFIRGGIDYVIMDKSLT